MLFSSITFLYYFLPCVLVLYFLAPEKLKNVVLLVSSLFFYGWGEPKLVVLMILTIIVGYILGLLTEKQPSKRKIYLILSIVYSLGTLSYFKYANFFVENINAATGLSIPMLKIALSIGISFYTFQILSYNIDVYRGEVPAQKNLLYLATYITMFPQLIAGPIVRYKNIKDQLESRIHSFDKAALGIRRFVFGLSKKVLLANSFGELCEVFRESGEKSILFYWMYAIAFSLQIYFDFSGYSDIAIGLGKVFGFDFMENFNYPYISKSITEFWRRWHISLGSWFKDYVYIPLGGSRVSQMRWFINILIVWMLTGFWHGAAWNFIIWGLYFAILLVIEKLFLLDYLKRTKIFSHAYVVFLVVVSFVIFNASSMGEAVQHIGGMFGVSFVTERIPLVSAEAVYYLKSYAVLLGAGIVGVTPVMKVFEEKIMDSKAILSKVIAYAEPVILLVLVILVTAYLVDGSFNPFLYFRF